MQGYGRVLLDAVKDAESPERYWYWSFLTAISATVGKRVYINRRNLFKTYLNLYTFILSEFAGLRKGPPISLAQKLLHSIGKTRIIEGQATIQGILKELSQVSTTKMGNLINTAEGVLIAGEFDNFLIKDPQAIIGLTDLYDAHYHEEGWKKRLAHQDTIELTGLCLTGLFGANLPNFNNAVSDSSKKGGFLSRCVCVYETKRRTINSLFGTDNGLKEVNVPFKELSAYLSKVSELKGEIRGEKKAEKLFDSWYTEFHKKDVRDVSGISERIADNILKAAALISLSKSTNMIISEEDMEEALDEGMRCLSDANRVSFGGSKSPMSAQSKAVLTHIVNADNYEIARTQLLKKGYGDYDTYDLDRILESGIQAGMFSVMTKVIKGKEDRFIKLKEEVVEKLKKSGILE